MQGNLAAVARALAFILLALALCGVIFQFAGYSAVEMFQSIADGAFLNPNAWQGSLRWAMPLFITACGVVVSFRSGYFNVGAQGQFYMGAIGATFVVDFLNGYPAALVVPLAFVAAMVCGALWAAWPGYLRVTSGADEVITTLMGNFIASLILIYVTGGILKDPSGTGQVMASRPVAEAYRISSEVGLSPAIVGIAVVVGVLTWMLVNRTAFGVLCGLAGRNPTMVVWQGARMSQFGLAAFALSGALAGLAGVIEVLGPNGRLVSGFLPTHGFTAILIALVAGLSVAGAAIVSLFFGGLAAASLYLPFWPAFPPPRSTSSMRRSRSSSPPGPRLDWRGFCRGDAPREARDGRVPRRHAPLWHAARLCDDGGRARPARGRMESRARRPDDHRMLRFRARLRAERLALVRIRPRDRALRARLGAAVVRRREAARQSDHRRPRTDRAWPRRHRPRRPGDLRQPGDGERALRPAEARPGVRRLSACSRSSSC